MRRLVLVALIAACTPANADRAPTSAARRGTAVLAKYCVKCHGPRRAEGDFGFAHDTARLVAHGLVVAGDPDTSPIVRRIEAGEMPPEGARPSKAELAAVRAWIAELATSARFRSDADLDRLLAADAARLDGPARTRTRYLSLVPLANAGIPEAQLASYRSALAVLLASLTWSPAPAPMTAIDRERTLFRIDLDELGWSGATWDLIRASYPYGVARPRGVPEAIRADWFVATASRGALYHAILGLPEREDELARLLGIDLAANRAAGDVVRAGFGTSGVSVNNRVIERHATQFGAYWRSFDFGSSVGFENIFRHPLDFVPAGGEVIFNLPDGMQAYLLVDRNARRIDKAPTAIVSDPRRPDRAVETALSCFGCHGAGIVERADQLRDSTSDPRVHRLHPTADELAQHYTADRARFATALARTGATPALDPAREPLTLLAARYEAELDVRLAAAELGLRPADLTARIARSPRVRRELAALASTGGTIKRDAWVAAFPRVVFELGLGIPFTPTASGELGPAVWIDRDRNTWVALDSTRDRSAAERACAARGAELPRSSELVAAARAGLAGGVRVTSRAWTREQRLDVSNQRHAITVELATAATSRTSPTDRHVTVCIHRRTEAQP